MEDSLEFGKAALLRSTGGFKSRSQLCPHVLCGAYGYLKLPKPTIL